MTSGHLYSFYHGIYLHLVYQGIRLRDPRVKPGDRVDMET